jgi:plasmid stability protein
MATLSIRNIDDGLKAWLKRRAAAHGRSMEEEARRILRDALDREPRQTLADIAAELFGTEYGVELDLHPPVKSSPAPDFTE